MTSRLGLFVAAVLFFLAPCAKADRVDSKDAGDSSHLTLLSEAAMRAPDIFDVGRVSAEAVSDGWGRIKDKHDNWQSWIHFRGDDSDLGLPFGSPGYVGKDGYPDSDGDANPPTDVIRTVEIVPEPSTLMLLCIGLGFLGTSIRRRLPLKTV